MLFFSIIAAFILGFFDYVGFNRIKPTWFYRIVQLVFSVGIYLLLYVLTGNWWSSIILFILHQTFCIDFIYYLYYDSIKWYGGNYAGKAYTSEVLGDKVFWAWWTPYGLIFRLLPGKKKEPIPGRILILQGIIGFVLGLAIQIAVLIELFGPPIKIVIE
jgi:hypothetical protein